VTRAKKEYGAYISAYGGFYLQPGDNNVETYFYYDYQNVYRARYVPVITWVADSFDEWEFPDPTCGGLMPGMTDARLKQIFGISSGGWHKSNTLDLWNWDFLGDDGPVPPQPGGGLP
jgi:hypothetical protein